MEDVRVVTIPLCEVEYHPRNFDSNNHYAHELPTGRHEAQLDYPEGYRKVMARTHYSRWKVLRELEHETEFVLTPEDCETICVAGESGALTLRLPESHKEEIEAIAARMDMPQPPYFARLDACSTKGGKGGVGPFHTPMDVLTALVTSERCCDTLKRAVRERESRTLYLLPWRYDISLDREFRAFVRGWRMTAISQYNWTEDCGWTERTHELPTIAHNTSTLVGTIQKTNEDLGLDLPSDFCLDVFCRRDLSVELIELNSYGAQMAAGSCLFHWLKDYDQLYGLSITEGEKREVEFRVVRPTSETEKALLELGMQNEFRHGGFDELLDDVPNKLAALSDEENGDENALEPGSISTPPAASASLM